MDLSPNNFLSKSSCQVWSAERPLMVFIPTMFSDSWAPRERLVTHERPSPWNYSPEASDRELFQITQMDATQPHASLQTDFLWLEVKQLQQKLKSERGFEVQEGLPPALLI